MRSFIDVAVSLGCVVCRNLDYGPSPASFHHLRTGVGTGQRNEDEIGIPLCPQHHQHGGPGVAFHAGPREWQRLYGDELKLLAQTIREVTRALQR